MSSQQDTAEQNGREGYDCSVLQSDDPITLGTYTVQVLVIVEEQTGPPSHYHHYIGYHGNDAPYGSTNPIGPDEYCHTNDRQDATIVYILKEKRTNSQLHVLIVHCNHIHVIV